MPGSEKRRAPRSRHNSVLEIIDATGRKVASIGRLVNVSAVGACFATTKSFETGQRFRVRIRLLREGRLEASARIVWSRRKTNTFLYGIEFDRRAPI